MFGLFKKTKKVEENKKPECNHDWETVRTYPGIYVNELILIGPTYISFKIVGYSTSSSDLALPLERERVVKDKVCLKCGECHSELEDARRWFADQAIADRDREIEKRKRKDLAQKMWADCH